MKKRARILWAENNIGSYRTFEKTLSLFLESRGITATIANAVDGNEVYRLLPTQPWDLLVVDIDMPNFGGLELIKDLSSTYPGLRKVVVSDHTGDAPVAPQLRALLEKRMFLGAYSVEPREAWCNAILRAVSSRPPTILHLSDIHFGTFHALPDTLQLEELLFPFIENIKRTQRIDIVAVTGDLSSKAEEGEFKRAVVFLRELMRTVGVGMDRLLVIPGNHDIFRPAPEERRFGNYVEFVEELYRSADAPTAIYGEYRSLYDEARKIWKREPRSCKGSELYRIAVYDDLQLVVVGLNSVVTQNARLDYGEITPSQLNSVRLHLDGLVGAQSGYVRIALLHHHLLVVPSFLTEGFPERIVRNQSFVLHSLLGSGVRVVLHGHTHFGSGFRYRPYFVESKRAMGRSIDVFSAGTLSGRERDPAQSSFSMNLIVLEEDVSTGVLDHGTAIPYRLLETTGEWSRGDGVVFRISE